MDTRDNQSKISLIDQLGKLLAPLRLPFSCTTVSDCLLKSINYEFKNSNYEIQIHKINNYKHFNLSNIYQFIKLIYF